MEFKDLKKIIDLIKANDIGELELQDGDFRLSAKLKGVDAPVVVTQAAPVAAAPVMPAAAAAPAAAAPSPAADAAPSLGETIDSPMVGTFYRSPSPDSDPFVKVGDTVDSESVVCIVEAMKVMNEIKAEKKGKITKILAENADAIEFGQPLFEIEPA